MLQWLRRSAFMHHLSSLNQAGKKSIQADIQVLKIGIPYRMHIQLKKNYITYKEEGKKLKNKETKLLFIFSLLHLCCSLNDEHNNIFIVSTGFQLKTERG